MAGHRKLESPWEDGSEAREMLLQTQEKPGLSAAAEQERGMDAVLLKARRSWPLTVILN